MELSNRRALKSEAAQALAAARNPRKLVSVYAGVSLGLSLVLLLADLGLQQMMEGPGGLSNMGNLAILETVQTLLPYAQLLFLLCWELGFLQALVQIGRRQPADERTMLGGFRLLGPALRAYLLQMLIYIGVFMASMYLGSIIYAFTPLASPAMELLEPYAAEISAGNMEILADETLVLALTEAMMPAMIVIFVIFAVAAAFIAYRYRMVNFCLLENPRAGARVAMRASRVMMRGNCWKLVKLDLSFWWYYLLLALAGFLAYGDMVLGMLGVTLSMSYTVTAFLFYALYSAVLFAIYYFVHNQVQETYVMAYEAMRPRPQPQSGGVVLGNIFQM